jgi:hypothetical protein
MFIAWAMRDLSECKSGGGTVEKSSMTMSLPLSFNAPINDGVDNLVLFHMCMHKIVGLGGIFLVAFDVETLLVHLYH